MVFKKPKPPNDLPNVNDIYRLANIMLKEKGPGYRIRRAEEKDLGRVMEINRLSLPENYPPYFFHDLWERYNDAFYVAESPDGVVVGYIMCRVERKPGFFRHFMVKSGHIVSIAVMDGHRRRGLGYALMAYALKGLYESYGCEETYLEVRVTNKPAINLYEKLGYIVVKIAHRYYLDGEDAYVMARPLP